MQEEPGQFIIGCHWPQPSRDTLWNKRQTPCFSLSPDSVPDFTYQLDLLDSAPATLPFLVTS